MNENSWIKRGRMKATDHLSCYICYKGGLDFVVNTRKCVHCECEECLQIALDSVGKLPELFRAPSDFGDVPVQRYEIRRLDDLPNRSSVSAARE